MKLFRSFIFIIVFVGLFSCAVPVTRASTFDIASFISIYNRILSLLHNNVSSQLGQVAASLDSGLIAHFTFDSGSGTTVSDSSGNNNTATLLGGASWTSGKIGNGAVNLDGVNDYISTLPLSVPTTYSVSLWMKSSSNKGHVFDWDFYSYLIYYANALFFTVDGQAYDGVSTTCANNTSWHHIVVVENGNSQSLYCDGVLSGSSAAKPNPRTAALVFGTEYAGMLDDIRVYNRALSNSEISSLYSEGNGTTQPVETQETTQTSSVPSTSMSTPTTVTILSGNKYVRTDGSDVSCDGSTDQAFNLSTHCAFKTVQKGLDNIKNAGEILTIHAGDYSSEGQLYTKAGGSSIAPITITAAGGEHPIIARLQLNHSYVKVNGLEINKSQNASSGASGIQVSGSHTEITNNHFYNGYTGNPGSTAVSLYGDFNLVKGNLVEGSFANNTSFWIPFIVSGKNNTFSQNTVRNLTDVERVWDALEDNTLITNNEVYGMRWTGQASGVHPDIFQVVSPTASNNVVIENNYFHDLDSQIGINESANSSNWVIRNNVFANITQRMMLSVRGTKVYNNTFYNVEAADQNVLDGWNAGVEYKNNIIIGGSSNPAFGMFNASPMGTWVKCADQGGVCVYNGYKDVMFKNLVGTVASVIKRNVLGPQDCTVLNFGTDPNPYYSKTCYMKDATEVPLSNNFYSTPQFSPRLQSTIVLYGDQNFINGVDPKFVAAYTNCITNTCNFHLQSNSPLINKGVALSMVITDADGRSRPQSGVYDIGAYEYSGSTQTTIPSSESQTPSFTPSPTPSPTMIVVPQTSIGNTPSIPTAGTNQSSIIQTPSVPVFTSPGSSSIGEANTTLQGTNTTIFQFNFTRNMKLGMKHPDIKELQKYLNAHGFTVAYSGSGSAGNETTYFGPATYKAVVKFQEAHRAEILSPLHLTKGTGFVGPSTLKVLNKKETASIVTPPRPNASVQELINYIKLLMKK